MQAAFIPGTTGRASINFLESVQMALEKLRRPKPRLVDRRNIRQTEASYKLPTPTFRRTVQGQIKPLPAAPVTNRRLFIESHDAKTDRIKRELIEAGITVYGLRKSESRILPLLIHDNERIEAIVYGQHKSSSVMLVATDERILFVDKKPMAVFLDEVSYEVVSGLEFEIHTLFASLTLHTPVKNYDIHFANLRCAENFARHIEAHRLKRESDDGLRFQPKPMEITALPAINGPLDPMAVLSGYGWLPNEEEELLKLRQGL